MAQKCFCNVSHSSNITVLQNNLNSVFSSHEATKDPTILMKVIQFLRTQAGIKSVMAEMDGVSMELMANKSYPSDVEMCGGEGCTYTV